MIRFAALLLVACLLAAAPVSAGSNLDARLVIHLTAPTTKSQCISGPRCDQIVSQGSLYPAAYYAYVLVTNGDAQKGIAGLQLGINYDATPHSGVDVFGWTLCATMNFSSPEWPASGSGNMITWDYANTCQRYEPGGLGTGVVANAGYFYVAAYSPDNLEIIPRPVDGYAKVADCAAAESNIEGGSTHHDPSRLGFARFSAGGLEPGYNPCLNGPPAPLTCGITGPTSVVKQSVGNSYLAASNMNGTTFSWELLATDDAVIVGPTTGPTVTVTAGVNSTFTLNVTALNDGRTSRCSRMVTVTPTPSCLISGPANMVISSNASYSVTSSSPGATFAWSISGAGSIVGATTGSTVQVTAGAATGAINLSVVVTSGGYTGTCTRSVTVLLAPECTISGPSSVLQTTSNTYTVTTFPDAGSYAWSITGNGNITSASTGASVQVTALNPGTYVLTCSFVTANGPGTCQKTVAVEAGSSPGCAISGETAVIEGSPNHQYQVTTSYSGAGFDWSIEGNGTITSATTGAVIRVTAGSTGSFRVTVAISAPGVADTCGKTVIVDPTPRSQPGANNNAKVMFHILSPTTKAPCTRSGAMPECNAVITQGNLYPSKYYAYVLLNDGYTDGGLLSGIGSIEFGIDYDGAPGSGVDVYSWTSCGTSEMRMTGWPGPGSGNRVVWDPASACQRYEPGGVGTGVVTTAGFLYIAAYTPGTLSIIPPAGSAVRVTDCQGVGSTIEGAGVSHFPSHLGQAGFGGFYGYNPCGMLMPVVGTTWSRLKTLYR